MKCKNIECQNETTGKNLYCSLTCRNIYVNKYIRNYDKVREFYSKKKQSKETEYLKNPKLCLHCKEIIPYDNKRNNYCNHSCAASSTNPLRKGVKHNMSKEGLENIKKSNALLHVNSSWLENVKKANSLRMKNNKIECLFCTQLTKNKKFCCKECQNNFKKDYIKNNNDLIYSSYKNQTNFNFNLANYESEFDFSLIEKHGWYSPTNKNNNLSGVSRDHMLSVREGFELGIDPKLLSHPANCKLMIHNENISKNKSSSITYEELLERIKYFNEKYNLVDSSGNRTQ